MNTIEKIRAEIERRREANKRQYQSSAGGMSWQRMCGEEDCLVELLSFLDTLEEETSYDTPKYTPSPSVDIGDVARVQFASHAKVFDKKRKAVFDWERFKEVVGIFYGFGKKDSLDFLEPDKDLEGTAEEYEKKHTFQLYDGGGLTPEYDATLAEAFIAGAEWQKAKMMGEAVDAHVVQSFNPCTEELKPTLHGVMLLYEDEGKPYLVAGDDTKIIILPKEDEK